MRVSSSVSARTVSAYPKDDKVLGIIAGPPSLREGGYAVAVDGDCMTPLILHGEKVAIEPTVPSNGDIVCLFGKGPGGGWIKRLCSGLVSAVPIHPGSEVSPIICVEQINPPRTYYVDGATLLAIHRVTWVLRNGEWLSVECLARSLAQKEARHA